ncbi:hypothetical protein [Methylobacterium goesingense]|uniref:Uncharacterized protein n=1 Tax=Methylobacterium goesingense TaxID=243690 RepID=A0ABV2L2S1_9HYPH|nr:hypothetical protein [Methylobacterium goesingense]
MDFNKASILFVQAVGVPAASIAGRRHLGMDQANSEPGRERCAPSIACDDLRGGSGPATRVSAQKSVSDDTPVNPHPSVAAQTRAGSGRTGIRQTGVLGRRVSGNPIGGRVFFERE